MSISGSPLGDELVQSGTRFKNIQNTTLPLPQKTRVFSVSNQKGGVGKTTTTVNIAAALAEKGAKVLVIDLDPQGNASTALGIEHGEGTLSVYEVLTEGAAMTQAVKTSPENPNLTCLPATMDLAGAEIEIVTSLEQSDWAFLLKRALETYLSSLGDRAPHYVFIDCPPSLGILTVNAFVAATEVLLPIQCEYYALEGLSQLLRNIERIQSALNPSLVLSTIILTMFDSRTKLATGVVEDVRKHFPAQTLNSVIPRNVRVSEAPSFGRTVISHDKSSLGSLSYFEAAIEIAQRGAANGR